jgi:hypothetical protein
MSVLLRPAVHYSGCSTLPGRVSERASGGFPNLTRDVVLDYESFAKAKLTWQGRAWPR